MTKIAVFSDCHIHPWSEFAIGGDRLHDCVSVLTDVRAYCVKHNIRHVLFGGDLFHKRGVLWTAPYVAVANELLAYKEAGIEFYACAGNHDHEDRLGEVHALQPLIAGGLMEGVGSKGYRNVRIGNATVSLFSYCEEKKLLAKRIKRSLQSREGGRIALFHHGFKGARVGSTLEYVVKEPIDARELKLHKLYDLVLSGHYHVHQRIVGIPNGWYVGSPLEHTRSDRTEDRKGFLVVDTKALTFKRVPLDRPRFISLSVGDPLTDVPGNFVDVSFAKADEALDAYLQSVKDAGARGINPIPLPGAKRVTKRLNVSPTLSPKKVVKRYVKHKQRELKKASIDRDATLQLGYELLVE